MTVGDRVVASGLEDLQRGLMTLDRVVVAFSGGADSALLARVAHDTLGADRVRAVTAVSPSLAGDQLADAAALAGEWSLPGGAIELGETLHEGLRRELREEIGIETKVGPLVGLFDRITRDTDGQVRYHYVLADYLCHHVSGELRPGSDADAVTLADPTDLSRYGLTEKAESVIGRAVQLR